MSIISLSPCEAGNDNRVWAGDVSKWLARGRPVKWGTINLPAELDRLPGHLRERGARKSGTYVAAEVQA